MDRFVSYSDNHCQWGIERDTGIVSGTRLLGGRFASLKALIAADGLTPALDEARALDPDRRLDGIHRLPVIPDPGQIFCAGLNYADHAAETGNPVPKAPRIFARTAPSLAAADAPLIRPRVSTQFDFEGEIAVVIGKSGRHIPEDRALDHVAGYACFMDGSLRDWQKWTTTLGKNFEQTGAFGPALVAARDVPDWTALTLVTRVNGVETQRVDTAIMIYTIPRLIAFLSQMITLSPGDVIVTGTPKGIGSRRVPPLWLRPGDVVEVEVTGLGILRNHVVDEGA